MDRDEEKRQWFQIALNDWKVADHILNCFHPVPLEQVCNLAHQSIEKDLKGFLFVNQIDPPKIHDLMEVLDLCCGVDSHFECLMNKCRFVNRFGVIPRYPHELQLNDDDAGNAVKFAKEVKDFIKEKI